MSEDSEKREGPGPAHYSLPSTVGHNNHDISKSRSPSFSMGVRLPGLFCDQNVQSASPGPKYQVENLTKFGKASIASSISSLNNGRTRSQIGSALRMRSLDRSESRNTHSRFDNSPDNRTNSRSNNIVYENQKGEVNKASTVKPELKSFCREFDDTAHARKPRISSARRFNANSSRCRTDVRHPRY